MSLLWLHIRSAFSLPIIFSDKNANPWDPFFLEGYFIFSNIMFEKKKIYKNLTTKWLSPYPITEKFLNLHRDQSATGRFNWLDCSVDCGWCNTSLIHENPQHVKRYRHKYGMNDDNWIARKQDYPKSLATFTKFNSTQGWIASQDA